MCISRVGVMRTLWLLRWGLPVVGDFQVLFIKHERGDIFDDHYVSLLLACMDGWVIGRCSIV